MALTRGKPRESNPAWGIVGAILVFAMGFVCVVFPRQLQKRVIRRYEQSSFKRPFEQYARSPHYVGRMRLMGSAMFALGILVLLVSIAELLEKSNR